MLESRDQLRCLQIDNLDNPLGQDLHHPLVQIIIDIRNPVTILQPVRDVKKLVPSYVSDIQSNSRHTPMTFPSFTSEEG
jgi:hypothetical protein